MVANWGYLVNMAQGGGCSGCEQKKELVFIIRLPFLSRIHAIKFTHFHGTFQTKTSRDRKKLPRKHLIGCQGVKLFLPKDFFF